MTLYGIAVSPAIATWQTHGPHYHGDGWQSQVYPYHQIRQSKQVTMPQEWSPTGICPDTPSLEHLHLWPAKHHLWKVCTCWRPSNHACWWRLEDIRRGAEQGHGNRRWIPLDLESKAQHYKNGVSSLKAGLYRAEESWEKLENWFVLLWRNSHFLLNPLLRQPGSAQKFVCSGGNCSAELSLNLGLSRDGVEVLQGYNSGRLCFDAFAQHLREEEQ